jgi:2-polyprenyl-3-methyl-5-hydroxy-6-metoxy-1,4-benzoquinol methylase
MTKCILCNSTIFNELFSGKNWKVLKCVKCGLVKVERTEENVSYDFYHRDSDYKKLEDHFRNIFQKRVNLVKRFTHAKGKVLEIGCSNGTMLDIFAKDGWETWGVEPSENAEYAIDKGHKVMQTVFEKVNFQTKFDLIIMNHTLEHIENPLVVLKKAYDLLEKDGIILIDVPNFDSLSSNISGKYWQHLLPLEHNFQFTKESLTKLFEKTGFKVIRWESRSGIFEFADPLKELNDSLLGLKKRFITHIINLPYDIVATAINKGDSMTLIGKK